jgi:hypothetical protein
VNAEQLAALGQNAKAFAACYVALTDALRAEGVPEDVARREARATAAMMAVLPEHREGEPCPLCGQ